MAITLTEAAARQINSSIAKRGRGFGLRVGVKPVGCSGLSYTYEIADEPRPGEAVFEGHGARLLTDEKALAFIDGARFDFVTEGLRQAFSVANPNVESMCGCGESFNVKAGVA